MAQNNKGLEVIEERNELIRSEADIEKFRRYAEERSHDPSLSLQDRLTGQRLEDCAKQAQLRIQKAKEEFVIIAKRLAEEAGGEISAMLRVEERPGPNKRLISSIRPKEMSGLTEDQWESLISTFKGLRDAESLSPHLRDLVVTDSRYRLKYEADQLLPEEKADLEFFIRLGQELRTKAKPKKDNTINSDEIPLPYSYGMIDLESETVETMEQILQFIAMTPEQRKQLDEQLVQSLYRAKKRLDEDELETAWTELKLLRIIDHLSPSQRAHLSSQTTLKLNLLLNELTHTVP